MELIVTCVCDGAAGDVEQAIYVRLPDGTRVESELWLRIYTYEIDYLEGRVARRLHTAVA